MFRFDVEFRSLKFKNRSEGSFLKEKRIRHLCESHNKFILFKNTFDIYKDYLAVGFVSRTRVTLLRMQALEAANASLIC